MVVTFLCLLTVSATAQANVSGYTSIDYDESTNTVIAYSETDTDYSLVGEYRAYVTMTVRKDSGSIVANGSANDTHGNGFASILLEFAGEPNTTYTAVGRHRVYLELWDYYPTYPYEQFFYDNWYFTNFEGQNINALRSYDFFSPSYFQFRRRNEIVPLGSTYDSVSTNRPIVTIFVPPNAMDGDTVEFSVSVQDETPTGYQWSFETTSGGNNPQVNFSNPTAATTTAQAHWFAKPNQPCSPNQPSPTDPYYNSQYKIKVRVTFQTGSPINKEAPFKVNAYWFPTGNVDYPRTQGDPEYRFDATRNLWTIIGAGTLNRIVSPVINHIPTTSQFHNKVQQHEEVHITQWETGMWSDLYKIDNLLPRLLLLTNSELQPLQQEFFRKKEEWREDQRKELIRRLPAGEREAYNVSDQIAPRYAYQNCNRF